MKRWRMSCWEMELMMTMPNKHDGGRADKKVLNDLLVIRICTKFLKLISLSCFFESAMNDWGGQVQTLGLARQALLVYVSRARMSATLVGKPSRTKTSPWWDVSQNAEFGLSPTGGGRLTPALNVFEDPSIFNRNLCCIMCHPDPGPDPWPFPPHDCPPLPPPPPPIPTTPPTPPFQAETVTQVGKHLHLFIQPLPLTCPTSSPSPSSTIWRQMLDCGSRNYSIKSMEGSEQIIYAELLCISAAGLLSLYSYFSHLPVTLVMPRVTTLLMQLQHTIC